MAPDLRSFNVGEVRCTAISDGTFTYPTGWFFSNVAQPQLEESLGQNNLPVHEVVSPYTCLLVATGREKVLVDTGADGLASTTGNLMGNLLREGVKADAITTVVLTHAHPDHIGGALDRTGKPAFPNARYIIAKTEWDFWTSSPDLSASELDPTMKEFLITCAQKNLPPLKPQIELIEKEKEVVPGVVAIPAPGHTPGHIALVISSAAEQLLHLADSVLHPLHMKYPSWRNAFDLEEDEAADTRQKLLDRAAAEKANVLAYHFPFPGLGPVEKRGGGWSWEPAMA
jgi:glyoxylase-like metal-dependent hydrolase (beta-lactamase superfamily II)